ncbi:MAG: hypothetical protein HY535_07905 [Chloroflexi bacterium]|nr:hypothetical protein [Chloroflexota bacterium]
MEAKELLQQILRSPETAAFSRIRNVARRLGEEDQAQFLHGLFIAAVEARESGDWDSLLGYIEQWEERGVAAAGAQAKAPAVGAPPFTLFRKPLKEATFALVTTGGVYVEGQEPYVTDGPDGMGDWSFREISKRVPRPLLRVAHLHYDLSGPRKDINCVFPIDRFQELENEGVIGQLAEVNYSFMGYIQKPEELMATTAPEVARRLRVAGVDAVFLSST